jgi:hypothetical protein
MAVQQFSSTQSRRTWDYLIQRYGELALLRQPGLADRWIIAIVGQFTALERMGGVSNPADRKALVSTISPDTGVELTPDPSERDVFVALKFDDGGAPLLDAQGTPQTRELLKIVAPPAPVGNTSVQLYWKLQVRA